MNRDFYELEHIAKKLSHAKIEIYSNNFCLKDCPMINFHANAMAHSKDVSEYTDYPLMYCQRKLLSDPVEYIRSPFVRPEDISAYEEIGIENFKLIDRSSPTTELVKRATAYADRNFDGNLLDICQASGFLTAAPLQRNENESELTRITNDIRAMRGLSCRREAPQHIHIDNKKLTGFIDYFKDGKCTRHCKYCGHCESVADKVISVNSAVRNELLSKYDELERAFIK
jgi:collagenase-like PrtC family protease